MRRVLGNCSTAALIKRRLADQDEARARHHLLDVGLQPIPPLDFEKLWFGSPHPRVVAQCLDHELGRLRQRPPGFAWPFRHPLGERSDIMRAQEPHGRLPKCQCSAGRSTSCRQPASCRANRSATAHRADAGAILGLWPAPSRSLNSRGSSPNARMLFSKRCSTARRRGVSARPALRMFSHADGRQGARPFSKDRGLPFHWAQTSRMTGHRPPGCAWRTLFEACVVCRRPRRCRDLSR